MPFEERDIDTAAGPTPGKGYCLSRLFQRHVLRTCSGVAVTVECRKGGVRHGAHRVERNGVVASRDLDALMPLRAGELANVSKLGERLRRLRTAYGKQGYVLQRAVYTPRLDDEKKQVAFDVKIEEDPQFRFGTLTFPGLSPDAAQTLTKRWRLKRGDIFDASYTSQCFIDDIQARLRQERRGRRSRSSQTNRTAS